jgi:DNA-binding MarR family transcriptional regulator
MQSNPAVEALNAGRRFYEAIIPSVDASHFAAMWHLVTVGHLVLADLDRIAEADRLSIADLHLLGTVRVAEDRPLRPTDLARSLFLSRPTLTARIGRLIQAGLLAREADEADRRAILLRITPKGAEIVDRAIVRIGREAAFARLFRQLPESDRSELERILGKVHGALLRFVPLP